jgi:hypothetical protein
MYKKIKAHLPLILFHLVFFLIAATNLTIEQQLIGWDGLYPQFNFGVNFQRAFFATWQENYGLGAITGHGFAGTLPHTLATYLLSFIVPDIALRITFTLLCLYLGGLGMYFLLKNTFSLINREKHEHMAFMVPYAALSGALFYMLNLGTIQIFYIQLETFIGHFAALPWLFLITIKLLHKWDTKNLLAFIIITFLSSIQGFIPSLFVAYFIALALFLFTYCLHNKLDLSVMKRSGGILFLTLVINSFWLTPLIFYQFQANNTFLTSYNNTTSTQHFIDISKKYGDINNVALLKGYLFDSYQLGDYILRPWMDHLNRGLPVIIGYSFFGVIIFGLFFSMLRVKNATLISMAIVALFFFASIATDTQPFSSLINILQHFSPTYAQAFRTAFTKFSIGVSFGYSFFFAVGVFYGAYLLQKTPARRYMPLCSILLASLLIIYSLPIFQGGLLYDKLLLSLPKPYEDVMQYFKGQEDGRIADFPQDCAEGWYAYKWGYFGSGFYWYGIRQPILSRSFDVWNRSNEAYYWEIIQALREENPAQLDAIFNKYQVRWILYDPNAFYCRNQKSFIAHEALLNFLKNSPEYTLVKSFTDNNTQPILLFQKKNTQAITYARAVTGLENIGPSYESTGTDIAFVQNGYYFTDPQIPYDRYYPFRTLLTNRGQQLPFNISTSDRMIEVSTTIPQGLAGYSLTDFMPSSNGIPVFIRTRQNIGNVEVLLSPIYPQLLLDGKLLTAPPPTYSLGSFASTGALDTKLFLNGQQLEASNGGYTGLLYPTITNKVELFTAANRSMFSWTDALSSTLSQLENGSITLPSYKEGRLSVIIPKIETEKTAFAERTNNLDQLTPQSCNEISPSSNHTFEADITAKQEYIRLSSQNGSQCIVLHFPDLLTASGYLMELNTRNIKGNPLKLTAYNSNDVAYNDEYLVKSHDMTKTYHILQPTLQEGVGYSIQLQNISENREQSVNDFSGIRIWQLPYPFLITMTATRPNNVVATQKTLPIQATHPDPTGYSLRLPTKNAKDVTLILEQSFNYGWRAYSVPQLDFISQAFPFIVGKELSNHVLINNWANGWILQENADTFVVVFLPQYAQFGAIILTITVLTIALIRSRRIARG